MAGVSSGFVYHHFAGKEDIAATLFASGLHWYVQGFLQELLDSETAEAGVKACVRYHLLWFATNRQLASFMVQRRETELGMIADPGVSRAKRAFFNAANDWLSDHAEQQRIRSLPRELYYSLWMGPAQDYARRWLAGYPRRSMTQARVRLPDAAWASLRPAEPRGGDEPRATRQDLR